MSSPSRCWIDDTRACNCCSAPGPEKCPYPYLLADQATLERWFESTRSPSSPAPAEPPRSPDQQV